MVAIFVLLKILLILTFVIETYEMFLRNRKIKNLKFHFADCYLLHFDLIKICKKSKISFNYLDKWNSLFSVYGINNNSFIFLLYR